MKAVELRATPTERPCPECDGTGLGSEVLDEPWPGLCADDCVWCHGTGKVLQPIPVRDLAALRGHA